MRRLPVLLAICALTLPAQKQPFNFEAMMKLARLSEPHLSPDGRTVAFTLGRIDMEKNTTVRQIYTVPVAGGTPVVLTAEGNNTRPRWSPDGKRLAFLSTRSGGSQIWVMNPDGSEQKAVTSLSTEAANFQWTPDGKAFVFTSEVYPDCGADDACNKKKLDAEKASKVKARVYTSLLYRHWNQWQGARRTHILVAPASGGAAKDLTPGTRDVPPFSLGGGDDFAVSPDSKELVYVANNDPDLSMSTNNDLYGVPLEGGEPRKITVSLGADVGPRFSPDGKYLAWRMQAKAGFEADKWRLIVLERATGKSITLTEAIDRSVQSFTWSPDSTRLFFTLEDRGRTSLEMISATGGGTRAILSGAAHVDEVQFAPDGKTMIFVEDSGSRATDLYRVASGGGSPVALTRFNESVYNEYALTPFDEFWVEGAAATKVHSFLVKPPDYDAKKKYPVLFLIHGGPQSAWREGWSYRWNPQVFAAAGFVVVMPNPRGSTGYGQKFTDDISDDWGGKCYEDIMAVADHVAKQPWADASRFAAAGGSFGGYMVNWLLGHTDRFKALVSHAGVYDLPSMGAETEELWFSTWEFKGFPWENPESYAKWSPSKFVKDFKTPTLVIHGELDYRVPVGQGLQLFTGLQQMKVPSKMLLFPDEGHWILKPQNSELWYRSFLEWVTEWTRAKP